jgi:hypothetical protein
MNLSTTMTSAVETQNYYSSYRPDNVAPARKPSRLWLWFIAAFLLQAAAWTTWFVIASHHKVQEVPLAGQGGSDRR